MHGHYAFDTIFYYNPANGTLIPRYNIIINGIRINAGSPIAPNTSFLGLNLSTYVGRGILGDWDNNNRILTVVGFY